MSSEMVRRVSRQEIQLVQNLIERCLQLYMNQKEVVETLLAQAKIEPGFTELVWQKLEEENREFFKAYYVRLMVKHQIIEFNKLLEVQVQLMSQTHPAGVAPIPTPNESHVPLVHQNSARHSMEHTGPALKEENMHHVIGTGLHDAFSDGGSSVRTSLHSSVEMSSQVNGIDAPTNLFSAQNLGLIEGMNGGMIKSEVGYSGNSPYGFGADGNVLEARPSIADASVTSFSSLESTTQTYDPLLDADISSFGFLGQIPRNFSLSDLTADFSQTSDILESYPRSPFLPTDAESFLDPSATGEKDSMSKGLTLGDFGNE